MRTRRDRSKLLVHILAGATATWYCAAGSAQTTDRAQGAPTPASQPNPAPANTPTPAAQSNPTPASSSNPTPASRATPTPTSQQQSDDAQRPASTQPDGGVIGTRSQPRTSPCASLTGLPRAECERRDVTNTEHLPAGVTQGQMDRQAQRAAEAAREAGAESSSADTMREPPASAPATSTNTPASSAPAPASTPREDADTLNRPRQ